MGASNVWAQDLVPLLVQHEENDELFRVLIRLMLNLSLPVMKVFLEKYGAEELKDAMKTNLDLRHNFDKCQEHLLGYKSTFASNDIWIVLKVKLSKLLK